MTCPRVEHDRDVGGAVHEGAEVRLGAQHLPGEAGAVGGPDQGAHEGQEHQHGDRDRLGVTSGRPAARRRAAGASTPKARQ